MQFVGGRLCTAGFAGITLTSLLYALAPVPAALPVPVLDMAAAISGTTLGAGLLRSASLVGILSDIVAVSGAWLVGYSLAGQDRGLACAGWIGVILSILVFTIVDAIAGLVLVPLAADPALPAAYAAAKRLFDALFLTGTLAFGIGLAVFLLAELRAPHFGWGGRTTGVGTALGLTAAGAALACMAGARAELVAGGCIGAGGLLCTWLSARIARTPGLACGM